jgi:hypothetical protein
MEERLAAALKPFADMAEKFDAYGDPLVGGAAKAILANAAAVWKQYDAAQRLGNPGIEGGRMGEVVDIRCTMDVRSEVSVRLEIRMVSHDAIRALGNVLEMGGFGSRMREMAERR